MLRSIVHLSVITATIPRINSFIADVQTRKAGLALTEREYENYKSSKDSKNDSKNRSHNRSKNGSNGGSKNWSRNRSPGPSNVMLSFRRDPQMQTTHEFNGTRGDEIEMDVRDNIETGSQSSLQRNAVYQKTEFRWEEEYRSGSAAGVRHH